MLLDSFKARFGILATFMGDQMFEIKCVKCGLVFTTPKEYLKHKSHGCNAWECPECGTVYEKEKECDYCKSFEDHVQAELKISYQKIWNDFFSSISKNLRRLYTKQELLDMKSFYERTEK